MNINELKKIIHEVLDEQTAPSWSAPKVHDPQKLPLRNIKNENKSLRNLEKIIREVILEEYNSSNTENSVIKEYFKRNDFISAFKGKVDTPQPRFTYGSPEEEASAAQLEVVGEKEKPIMGEGPTDDETWPVTPEDLLEEEETEDFSQRFQDIQQEFLGDVNKRFRSISPGGYKEINFMDIYGEGTKMDLSSLSTVDKMLTRGAYMAAWKSLSEFDKKILSDPR